MYPGWGDSTFRVRNEGGASLAPFGQTNFSGGTTTGELPFVWGVFKPSKTLGTSINYTEGNPPVPLDSSGTGDIQDPTLDTLNGGLGNYDGASLTVQRTGMASTEDSFGFTNGNGLTLVGGTIQKAGATIAFFSNAGGTLTVNFTDAFGQIPTPADVDNILQQITYANTSPAPTTNYSLAVTFNNGLGAGGSVICQVNVTVTPVNTPPVIVDWGLPEVFVPGGNAIKLDADGNADIQDAELDFLNDYNSTTLVIRRQGGGNANDDFTFQNGNGLTLNAMNIQKNGQTIATFVVNNGTLTITFTNANGEIPTGGRRGQYPAAGLLREYQCDTAGQRQHRSHLRRHGRRRRHGPAVHHVCHGAH